MLLDGPGPQLAMPGPWCNLRVLTLALTLRRPDVEEILKMLFLILFVVLLLAWIFGFAVFHVAGAAMHILLVLAVISLIVHFVRGGTRAAV